MVRRLAAILAADAVGYSRLMEADEERTLATSHNARQFIDGEIAARGGRVFGSAGDSFSAEFSSPVEAVRCALAFQHHLEKENINVPRNTVCGFAWLSIWVRWCRTAAVCAGMR